MAFTLKAFFLSTLILFGLLLGGALSLLLADFGTVAENPGERSGYNAPWVYPSTDSK